MIKQNGYNFYYKKSGDGSSVTKRWVCSNQVYRGRKAAIYTIHNVIVSIENSQNHPLMSQGHS